MTEFFSAQFETSDTNDLHNDDDVNDVQMINWGYEALEPWTSLLPCEQGGMVQNIDKHGQGFVSLAETPTRSQ